MSDYTPNSETPDVVYVSPTEVRIKDELGVWINAGCAEDVAANYPALASQVATAAAAWQAAQIPASGETSTEA
jgi:hypothetical protein